MDHKWISRYLESYNNIIERKATVNIRELFPLSQFKLNSKWRLNQLKS